MLGKGFYGQKNLHNLRVKIVTDMASKMITGFLENGILGRTIYRKLHRELVIIL